MSWLQTIRNGFYCAALLLAFETVQTIHDGKENWRWQGYPSMFCLSFALCMVKNDDK